MPNRPVRVCESCFLGFVIPKMWRWSQSALGSAKGGRAAAGFCSNWSSHRLTNRLSERSDQPIKGVSSGRWNLRPHGPLRGTVWAFRISSGCSRITSCCILNAGPRHDEHHGPRLRLLQRERQPVQPDDPHLLHHLAVSAPRSRPLRPGVHHHGGSGLIADAGGAGGVPGGLPTLGARRGLGRRLQPGGAPDRRRGPLQRAAAQGVEEAGFVPPLPQPLVQKAAPAEAARAGEHELLAASVPTDTPA